MCDCKKDIEAKLLTRFVSKAPDAIEHSARLVGYALIIGNDAIQQKGAMTIELSAAHPLKKGGYKAKTERSNMIFNYCPFCGESYEKDRAEASNA